MIVETSISRQRPSEMGKGILPVYSSEKKRFLPLPKLYEERREIVFLNA